jgi:hypothetical protein
MKKNGLSFGNKKVSLKIKFQSVGIWNFLFGIFKISAFEKDH